MIEIYDYRHVRRNSFIIKDGDRFVLFDLELKTLSASRPAMLKYIISRDKSGYINSWSTLYKVVLSAYNAVLGKLPGTDNPGRVPTTIPINNN
ncbi:hypothetical protein GCM10009122_22950 [Fulvivirga kasyanovii]|uniref:Uncharacterized protein n=1 Tax=Fulvivirga kasyanovii TaxID=396812 RepID=A0ABW9S071_9BACT|nr:hypothetical protein [Fulvivirga kasyanovii]MTI28998.1 hypothetical protein [Fulvivirga kasyanovii]